MSSGSTMSDPLTFNCREITKIKNVFIEGQEALG